LQTSRNTVLDTRANSTLADNISLVFGSKFLSTLVPISFTTEITESKDLSDSDVDESEEGSEDGLSAFVSPPEESQPLTSSDDRCTDRNNASCKDNAETGDDKNSHNGGSVTVSGFVSKAGIGVGRSDNDRQFVFCNGRPVDLPKISRTVNEVLEL
jgi:DNA mismatch repair ATPase MutL